MLKRPKPLGNSTNNRISSTSSNRSGNSRVTRPTRPTRNNNRARNSTLLPRRRPRRNNNSRSPRPANTSRRNRASSVLPRSNNTNNTSNRGGISGIDNAHNRQRGNNLAAPRANNGMGLTQSRSSTVKGGILQDKSVPLRERINKFCDQFVIQRMTDLDIYTYDIDKYTLKMQCGHGMPKDTLFDYAEAQFKDGKKTLKCPHLKNKIGNKLCNKTWHC